MLKDLINFQEERDTAWLFGISTDRKFELQAALNSACNDIGASFDEFSTPADCGHAECFKIHLGKCLEKISNVPQNESESLFIAFCLKEYFDHCKSAILYFKTLDISI